jgi:hypothetical protein
LPKGTQIASIRTAGGFSTEIAIPVSYFNERQDGAWKAFRMNITQNDVDEASGPRTQIDWRPDWRNEQSFSGSGTFERR